MVKTRHKSMFVKGMTPWIKGRSHSEETKEKMRRAKELNPSKGVDWTADQKVHLQLAQTNRKEVVCIELDKTYPSISAASRDLGIANSAIRKVIKGIQHSAKGFTFKFIEKKEI